MAWEHCDIPFILDDEPCPTCGADKAKWTIEIDQTRVMQVARKRSFLELELLDKEGKPVAEAAYCFTFSKGRERKGKLDDKGRAKIRNLAPGTCTAAFPDHGIEEKVELEPEFCKGRESKLLTYTLSSGHWIEIKLQRKNGDPVAGEAYRIEFPDDEGLEPKEGKLDDNGFARVEDLPSPGACKVIFPNRLALASRELTPLSASEQPA